ncbi:hypothetical protein TNCV_3964961 [Trichonephila clavipes]|nr:hypothetical protein TNCV_3964961 [Trichonephila clavipes]
MKNITSCAVDGAPNMMGKKNGCLKLVKDGNPELILVHCVSHSNKAMLTYIEGNNSCRSSWKRALVTRSTQQTRKRSTCDDHVVKPVPS